MDEYERMAKHIEEIALQYAKENNLDLNNVKAVQEFSSFEVKAKADETRDGIWIKGYLSTFKNTDRHNDVVLEGAFKDSIRGLKKLPMLKDHRNSVDFQAGSWTKFKTDEIGLYVEGFLSRTKETEHTIRMIEDGHLDTLSMGGLMQYAQEKDKKGRWVIEKVYLLEGSIVSIPANPKATFTQKSLCANNEQVNEIKVSKIEKYDLVTMLKSLLDDEEIKESKYFNKLKNELEEIQNER